MDDQNHDFDEVESAAAERRRVQELDDFYAEMNGDEVGRQSRFLSADARQALIDKRNGKPSKAMSALERALMDNPGYAALYEAAIEETRDARVKADAFPDKISGRIEQTKQEIADLIDAAVTLPKGDKAFLDANGQAWTLENELVDPSLVEGIDWTGRPSREDLFGLNDRLKLEQDVDHEGRILNNRLGEIEVELLDTDNPLTADEIKERRKEIKEIYSDYDGLEEKIQVSSDLKEAPATKVVTPSADSVPSL